MAHKESIKEKKARLQREKDGPVLVTAQPSLETLESSASDTEASDSPSEEEESVEGEVSDDAGNDSSDLDVSEESDEEDEDASSDGTSDGENVSSAAASEGKSNRSSAASHSEKGKARKSNTSSRSSRQSKDEAEYPPVGGKPRSGLKNGGVAGLFNTRVVDQPVKEVELVAPKSPSSPSPSSVGKRRSKAPVAEDPASPKEIRSSVHATVDQKQLLKSKKPFFEGELDKLIQRKHPWVGVRTRTVRLYADRLEWGISNKDTRHFEHSYGSPVPVNHLFEIELKGPDDDYYADGGLLPRFIVVRSRPVDPVKNDNDGGEEGNNNNEPLRARWRVDVFQETPNAPTPSSRGVGHHAPGGRSGTKPVGNDLCRVAKKLQGAHRALFQEQHGDDEAAKAEAEVEAKKLATRVGGALYDPVDICDAPSVCLAGLMGIGCSVLGGHLAQPSVANTVVPWACFNAPCMTTTAFGFAGAGYGIFGLGCAAIGFVRGWDKVFVDCGCRSAEPPPPRYTLEDVELARQRKGGPPEEKEEPEDSSTGSESGSSESEEEDVEDKEEEEEVDMPIPESDEDEEDETTFSYCLSTPVTLRDYTITSFNHVQQYTFKAALAQTLNVRPGHCKISNLRAAAETSSSRDSTSSRKSSSSPGGVTFKAIAHNLSKKTAHALLPKVHGRVSRSLAAHVTKLDLGTCSVGEPKVAKYTGAAAAADAEKEEEHAASNTNAYGSPRLEWGQKVASPLKPKKATPLTPRPPLPPPPKAPSIRGTSDLVKVFSLAEPLGMQIESDNSISSVSSGHQASKLGVKVGWQIEAAEDSSGVARSVNSHHDLTLILERRKTQPKLNDVALRFRDKSTVKALKKMANYGAGEGFQALCDVANHPTHKKGKKLAKWSRKPAVLRCAAHDCVTGEPLVLQGAGSSKGDRLVLVQYTGFPNQQWCWHGRTQRLAPAHCAVGSDDEDDDSSSGSSSSGGSDSNESDSDSSSQGGGGAPHSLVVDVDGVRCLPGTRVVLARPMTDTGRSARSKRGGAVALGGQRWCLNDAGALANGMSDGKLVLGLPEGEHVAEGTELVLVEEHSNLRLHWSLDFDVEA